MSQNPFLTSVTGVEMAPKKSSNPFLDTETFDPTQAPQKNALGRTVDDLWDSGKSAVGTILDLVGRPQQALYGAAMNGGIQSPEGREGLRAGWMGEKKYSGQDILEKDKVFSDSPTLQKVAGLGLDVVGDPLVAATGAPAVKAMGAVAKAAHIPQAAKKVNDAVHSAPVLGTGVKAVGGFFDPHYHLRGVDGLRDFARLKESEARSIQNRVHEDVATMVGKNLKPGATAGTFVKSFDDDTLKKISYHIDEGMTHLLSPEEQAVAGKFKKLMDDQWASETGSGVQAGGKLQDYVPYVTKDKNVQKNVSIISDVRPTTRFAKQREKATSLADAVKNYGASDHLGDIAGARLASGRVAEHGMRVFDEAAQKFGSQVQKPGFRKVNVPLPAGANPKNTQMFFPNEAADYVERAHAMFNKPDEVTTAYKNAVKVYKSWLVTNPQQAATNLMGNMVNSFMTGSVPTPRNMVDSAKIVMKGATPRDIGKYKGAEIAEAMKKYEIVGGQGQYQDIFSGGTNYSWNPFKANNAASRASQFANQHLVEEPFKVAQFLDNVEKGMDLEQAALKVKDTFFDYAEVSEPVKWLRDSGVSPFITWQVKNTPLQLENLAKRPQKFAQTESVYSAVTDPEAVVPHQDEREGMMPLGDNKLMRFASPLNDLNKLPIGDYEGADFLRDTLGGMAPWIKGPIELAREGEFPGEQGRSFYTGKSIWKPGQDGVKPYDWISRNAERAGLGSLVGIGENDMGERTQDELAAYILQQNPWNYWGRNLMAPPEDAQGNVPESTFMDRILGATGFRTKELSPYREKKELERRMQQIMDK